MTDYSCPKCGLVESTWAAQEDETGSGCPECAFIRIRELEAELAKMNDDFTLFMTDPTARYWHARAEKAEARVTELIDEINLIIRHYKIEDYDLSVLRESKEVYRYKDGRTIPVVRERKPAPASEGHEREEC